MDLAPLAQRSAELSRSLTTLGQQCEHVETHAGIVDIANETLRLSSTLWRLREAIDTNEDQYTEVFTQDLEEIASELKLVCDEIAECCAEMQKMDAPGPVPWFFKKGRVSKLQKHLVALKTTLIVMRTVLHHSKYYGLQSLQNDLAVTNPHVLQEDRAILDSIFAKNRDAIQETYDLEHDGQEEPQEEVREKHQEEPQNEYQQEHQQEHHQEHHQEQQQIIAQSHSTSQSALVPVVAETTGTAGPSVCNDLVADTTATCATAADADADADAAAPAPAPTPDLNLGRRFSKRGARLDIHTSILGMAAPDVTAGLSVRWLQANTPVQTNTAGQTAGSAPLTYSVDAKHPWGIPSTDQERDGSGQGDAKAETGGNHFKRLSSPAAQAVRKMIKKLSLRRPMASTKEPARDGEAQVTV